MPGIIERSTGKKKKKQMIMVIVSKQSNWETGDEKLACHCLLFYTNGNFYPVCCI